MFLKKELLQNYKSEAKEMQRNNFGIPTVNTSMLYGTEPTKRRKKRTKKKKVERHTYRIDRKELLLKQKGMCAYKRCPQLHEGRKRQSVTVNSHLDHKISVKLWELKGLDGNVNKPSNLQLLCPTCHEHKTAEDAKKIAKYKEEHGIKRRKRVAKRRTKRKKSQSMYDFSNPIKFKF